MERDLRQKLSQRAVNGYFEDPDKSAYQFDITALEHHWKERVEVNTDYVNKQMQI